MLRGVGTRLGNASIQSPLNASTSTGSARLLQASLGTQTEKGNALTKCRLGLRAWRAKKPMLCLLAATDEDGHPLENGDESGRRPCDYWSTIFQARAEGPRHHQYENIPDDIRWVIDKNEFDELMAAEKDSTPAPDGIPYSGTIPALFAESRTVFIPKSSDVDNNGTIVRSPEALRPLTLCNCDCKILTTAICRGLHWYAMRCISSRQMTDNIFEIETTALAHVACAPRESGFFFDRFCSCVSWCQSLLDLPRTGKTELPEFICRFLRRIYYDSTTNVEFAGTTRGQFLMARGVRQGCPASGFLFAIAFDPIFDGFKMQSFQGILMA